MERNANAIAAGRVVGIDPIEQITRRCIRIVKTFEAEVGGCVFCRLSYLVQLSRMYSELSVCLSCSVRVWVWLLRSALVCATLSHFFQL